MGDPKKASKKFSGPIHPWKRSRIEEESKLKQEFGLKNMREVWKARSLLKKYTSQAKRLSTVQKPQEKLERDNLITHLQKYGLIKPNASTNDVLNLTTHDILNRRLQTVVYRKGLAKSIGQARQMIAHSHILIQQKPVTSPGYFVSASDEQSIAFHSSSQFSNPDHPERVIIKRVPTHAPDKKEDSKQDALPEAKPESKSVPSGVSA